jgi:monothiol glutaredoxin
MASLPPHATRPGAGRYGRPPQHFNQERGFLPESAMLWSFIPSQNTCPALRFVALYCHCKNNLYKIMETPKIIAYLKPTCGWSNGVRAVLRKYDLPFEDRDIINDPDQRQEMVEKSGQMLSPCVEINGQMLADISGEEVEAWMLENKFVQPNGLEPEVPINQACGAHHRR